MVYDYKRKYRRSRRPFVRDGRKYYPLKRDALKRVSRRDESVVKSTVFSAYFVKRKKSSK